MARHPLDPSEITALSRLDAPDRVQAFLDDIAYSAEPVYRCPRSVLRDRMGHCFDGAVLAAAAFEVAGLAPRIVDLRAHRDDDHVITVFRRHGAWGAVAKSNVVGLRFREPVYRSLRELVMSYFDEYYNLEREKALREFSRPVDLRRFDRLGWRVRDEAMDAIAAHLDRIPHRPLLTAAMIDGLVLVDPRRFEAGLLGSNPGGLYKPWEH